MAWWPQRSRLTIKQVLAGYDRLGQLILDNRLDRLWVTENFLMTVYHDWRPLITQLSQARGLPRGQGPYWTAALTWLQEVRRHPEWVRGMQPCLDDQTFRVAQARIEEAQAAPPRDQSVLDLTIAGLQTHLRSFKLTTQSIGELAMIQRYWELTNKRERDRSHS